VIGYDPRSPVPPYEQVRGQLARQILAGTLAPGTRLPTVRRLAGDLGLAANTVARAYRELEQAGLVATRRRNGTVVTGADDDQAAGAAAGAGAGAADRAALAAAADYAARVRRLGVPNERAVELVRAVLAAGPA
jgi:DNA-binding transcriptional regulator YhcF (GntR family)